MAGETPHPAGTGQRVNFRKQTPHIVRQRTTCASCGTPIKGRDSHCRTCVSWHAIAVRTFEIARLLQSVQP